MISTSRPTTTVTSPVTPLSTSEVRAAAVAVKVTLICAATDETRAAVTVDGLLASDRE